MGRRKGEEEEAMVIVGEEYCDRNIDRQLTVRKTCLFYPGDGFAVYEGHHGGGDGDRDGESPSEEEKVGELVFRVENYGSGPSGLLQQRRPTVDHMILMGPQGEGILYVRRKRPSLHQRWEGFLCSSSDDNGDTTGPNEEYNHQQQQHLQHPIFTIRRSSIIRRLGSGAGDSFLVEAYPQHNHPYHPKPLELFHVEGSFPNRCCTVYAGERGGGGGGGSGGDGEGSSITDTCESVAVAEIVRKVDASTKVMLGKDVFSLHLHRGFDAAFAMGLILALDQITNNEEEENSIL